MTPPALPSLPGLSWSRHKKPAFSTRVASHVSGREVRLPLMSYPLYEFEAIYGGLASSATAGFANLGASSLQSLMGFFLQLLGQAGVFLYTDPDDNTVAGQSIGSGDGTTQCFIVGRTLGGFSEPVSYVTAINTVYLNGTAQPASNWQFTAPNMLAFATPPGAGAAITADFSFAFQCRFLDDQLDFEEFMSNLWKLDKLGFRSVKSNTSVAGAVIPTWYTPYYIGGTAPLIFADPTTEGTTNHYLYNGTTYGSLAALLTAISGTFARASPKYVVNSSGNLAQIGSNILPFDYSPSSIGTCNGLLLEGPSTNNILQSNALSTSPWGMWAGAGSVMQNVVGPDGTTSGWTVANGIFSGSYYGSVVQTFASGISNPSTLSAYVKKQGLRYAFLMLGDGANFQFSTFDLNAGTVGQNNLSQSGSGTAITLSNPTIVSASNGWYRISVTAAGNAINDVFVGFNDSASLAHGGTSSSSAGALFGVQLEQFAFASSYIPATSSSASRAADNLRLPWTTTTFTARVKATLVAQVNGGYLADTGIGLLTEAAGPDAETSNGAQTLTTGITTFTQSNVVVVGGSSSGRVLSANGGTAASDSHALVPSPPTNFYLGQSSTGGNQGNGDYAQLALHTIVATAAEAATYSGTA